MFMVVFYTINEYKKLYALNYFAKKFKPNEYTIIAGDSHTETSLNPDYIQNSVNISESAESYVFTYYKLKYLISHKRESIKNVILGFSYQNLTKKYQELTFYDDAKSNRFIGKNYIFLDDAGKDAIKHSDNYLLYYIKNDLGVPVQAYKDFPLYKSIIYTKILGRPATQTDLFVNSGFHGKTGSVLDKGGATYKIKLYYYEDNLEVSGVSSVMRDYLNKIVDMCVENNITLYLYNSPVYREYKKHIPEPVVNDYNEIKKEILSKHQNVKYIDMSDYALNVSDYYDGDHLVLSGATKASIEVDKLIGK